MGERKRKVEAVKRYSLTAKFIYEFTDRRNDTRTPECACLGCGAVLDAATAMEKGKRPKEGLFSICGSCGHVQAFDKDLKFRPLTDEEMVEIAGEPEVVVANNMRGKLRDFWKRDDHEGAYEFIVSNIRKDIRKARTR